MSVTVGVLIVAAFAAVVLLLMLSGGDWWRVPRRRSRAQAGTAPATAAMRTGLPPVPPAARHRRATTSPGEETATGVIRRIDPSLLPDRKDTPR